MSHRSSSRRHRPRPPALPPRDPELAAQANDMQLLTRKKNKFDEVEASLPDPKSPANQLQVVVGEGWFNRISSLVPFGKNISPRDVVWLFDNTAYPSQETGHWEAEFVAAVFEQEPKCKVVDVVTSIARTLGLADDAEARRTIEERLMPFLWDLQAARILRIDHRGRELRMGATSLNGITDDIMRVGKYHKGEFAEGIAKVPSGAKGILEMQTFYAGPQGWGIVSDVDDTIKVTLTSDPLGILRSTFVEPATPIRGMPELYADIKTLLPQDTPWFYLSASPYNLYPFLREFRDRFYPQGTMILRDSSWKTIAGLLSALTMGTEEYKVDRINKIQTWFPRRKMILIGDSTQSDPEAYAEVYRDHPEWIKLILIRKATDIASVGIDEKNQLERFEKAFKDVPREAWHVFEDPDECRWIIRKLVRGK